MIIARVLLLALICNRQNYQKQDAAALAIKIGDVMLRRA